jgi:hypothetical protein
VILDVKCWQGKQKSPMETTAKRLKIKRRYSDSKLKFVS